jgi:ubiquinone biosynthesis protein UbiJ
MIEAHLPLPLLLAAEHMFNQAINQDQAVKSRMTALAGLVFEIHLTLPRLRVFLTPTAQGGVILRRDFEGLSDAQISTSVFGMLRTRQGADGMDALFSGDIGIEGDQKAAESLLRLLSDLDYDVFPMLSNRIGTAPAGLIERRVMSFKRHFTEWRRTRQIEQADFLVYERQLLVDGGDVQLWMDGVDTARDHVDHLANRLQTLEQRAAVGAGS